MNEEKEYLTVKEVADELGITRATVYNYMNDLKIKARKFGRDPKAYLSQEQLKRIREYKESPWKVTPNSQPPLDEVA